MSAFWLEIEAIWRGKLGALTSPTVLPPSYPSSYPQKALQFAETRRLSHKGWKSVQRSTWERSKEKQVAQLSQRDRAAGWDSYGQKLKNETGKIFYGHYRSISNYCNVIGQQSNRIRWKKRKIILTSYLVPFRSYRSLFFKFWTLCVFDAIFQVEGVASHQLFLHW